MNRVFFNQKNGQRFFLEKCKNNLNCPSISCLLQFGIKCSVSSLKNYYSQRRLLPEDLFLDLCHLAKIDLKLLDIQYKPENWGKIKGGCYKKLF